MHGFVNNCLLGIDSSKWKISNFCHILVWKGAVQTCTKLSNVRDKETLKLRHCSLPTRISNRSENCVFVEKDKNFEVDRKMAKSSGNRTDNLSSTKAFRFS